MLSIQFRKCRKTLKRFLKRPAECGVDSSAEVMELRKAQSREDIDPEVTSPQGVSLPASTLKGNEEEDGSGEREDKEKVCLVKDLSSIPVRLGGRLSQFIDRWRGITSNPWVLQTVSGYRIDFVSTPVQRRRLNPLRFSKEEEMVEKEVQELLEKGAIERAEDSSAEFVSNIFLVEKKDKGMRPMISLKDLNEWVEYNHFKMEGIHMLRNLLRRGDWLTRLDLKDAYLTVPMCQDQRDLLKFQWKGSMWRFKSLPFGLTSAPWCFTKVMRPIVAWLRTRGGETHNLSGRHPHYGGAQRLSPRAYYSGCSHDRGSGICSEQEKVMFGSK